MSDHEHEHEHADEEEPVVDEALMAEGATLLEDSVRELPPEDLERILKGLASPIASEVVRELIGNKLDPRRLKNLGSLLIAPLRKRPASRLTTLLEHLSTGILGTFETNLGSDRFENPSFDDLREVLDAVLAEHPPSGVRCTLAWVVAEGMPAAQAARDVLVSDERLRLPGWPKGPEPS
ncbi:MAG TPA: hypothetical protein VFS16_05575 [Acidimicrobiia bacterium]|nr:hypothetical protein [Acidimicrobiia bacterium]